MNTALETFLSNLKEGALVHFVLSNTTIIGKFSKVDDKKESITLEMASVFSKTLAGETTLAVSDIVAWGLGGKYN